MIIGVPKEIKNNEHRVGLTPEAIQTLAANKHVVLVETEAGIGSGFSDADFRQAGALIVSDRHIIWISSNIVVKVKEPLEKELSFLKQGWPLFNKTSILFTFFHFPANSELKKIVLEKKIRALPYENIQLTDGSRPVLAAMSKIAAEISVDAAAHYLRKENGGKGKLLRDAAVIVIGCKGSVGKTAFKLLRERGSDIVGFDKNEELIPFSSGLLELGSGLLERKIVSVEQRIKKILPFTDLIICAAAARGKGAPKLITREMLKSMEKGSVVIDPSIDEGGCCETSRPTTHDNPIFVEEDIIHYCVANMPGAVPRSSTPALVKESLPYILEVANKGWEKALAENPILAQAAKID